MAFCQYGRVDWAVFTSSAEQMLEDKKHFERALRGRTFGNVLNVVSFFNLETKALISY